MKQSTIFRIVTALALMALAMQVGSMPGAGASNAATSQVTGIAASPAQQAATLAYWTHDKLANAKAFPMPVDKGDHGAPSQADTAAVGAAGFTAPGAAANNADALAKKAYGSDWADTKVDSAASGDTMAGSSQVFTSYYANYFSGMANAYPNRWIGRFTSSAGYCSGTALGNNTVVTAAHCVYDSTSNHWYSNFAFTPSYRNGSAPYGTFGWTNCWVLTNWINLSGSYSINGWTKYDVAVCKLGRNSSGYTLNQMVGYAGKAWNYGYINNFHTLGYPWQNTSLQNLTNAGKFLRLCTAESFGQTTDTMGMGCNWGPGISGGPWMFSYAPGFVQGYVDSVNSGLYIGYQNLYGIRFSSNNIIPICNVAGC